MWTLAVATLCYLLNRFTGEYSWGDRIWPICPMLHGANYLYHQQTCTGVPISTRQVVMEVMMVLWGLRLTYNFGRKGGFQKGGEDYRWVYLKENYHWILVELLSFFFVAYYQLILIQWFASPIYLSHRGEFNLVDGLLCVVWAVLFVV